MKCTADPARHLTRRERRGCNHCVPCAGSLSCWGVRLPVLDSMKTALNPTAAFILLLACSGCIPIPHYGVIRPGASGIVLDVQSKQSVADATVTMVNSTNNNPVMPVDSWPVVACVQTATDGSYLIPPKRGWRIWLLLNPGIPAYQMNYGLLVKHPSYERGERFFSVHEDITLFSLLPATPHLSPVLLNPSSN